MQECGLHKETVVILIGYLLVTIKISFIRNWTMGKVASPPPPPPPPQKKKLKQKKTSDYFFFFNCERKKF